MPLRNAAILVAVLVVSAGPGWAQSVTGGAKVGANFSNIVFEEDDEDDEDLDHRTGLVIGGFASVPFTELFTFQPEFLYSMKGVTEEEPDGDEITTKLRFLQFPLLFRTNFAVGTTRPFVVFGPAFGFRTSAEIDFPDGDEEDISDETETVEFSGIIGAGVQFGRAIVEVRYDYGFNDLDESEFGEARTRTFSILFGFDFAVFRNR